MDTKERKGPEGLEEKGSPDLLKSPDIKIYDAEFSRNSPISIDDLPVELGGFEDRVSQVTKQEIDEKYGSRVLLVYRVDRKGDSLGAMWISSEIASLGTIPLSFREFKSDIIKKLVIEYPVDLPEVGLLAISSFDKAQTLSFIEMLNTDKYAEKIASDRLIAANYIIPDNVDLLRLAIEPLMAYLKEERERYKSFVSTQDMIWLNPHNYTDSELRQDEDKKYLLEIKDAFGPDKNKLIGKFLKRSILFNLYPVLPQAKSDRTQYILNIINNLASYTMLKDFSNCLFNSPNYAWLIVNAHEIKALARDYTPEPQGEGPLAYKLDRTQNPLVYNLKTSLRYLINEERGFVIKKNKQSVTGDEVFLFDTKSALFYTGLDYEKFERSTELFVGEDLIDELDLSKSVITGSAISAVFGHLQSNQLFSVFDTRYPKYYTNPITGDMTAFLNDIKTPLDLVNLIVEPINNNVFRVSNPMVEPMAIVEFNYVPGADIDLAVITDDTEEFNIIANKHIETVRRLIGDDRLIVEELKRRTGRMYQLTDRKRELRPIQIYPTSKRQILTHHVSLVRGWIEKIDGKLSATLAATAMRSYSFPTTRPIVFDYYYFAGNKSGDSVLYKQWMRGFDISTRTKIGSTLAKLYLNAGVDIPFYRSGLITNQRREELRRSINDVNWMYNRRSFDRNFPLRDFDDEIVRMEPAIMGFKGGFDIMDAINRARVGGNQISFDFRPLGQFQFQPLLQLGQQPLGQQPLGQQPLGQQPLGQQPLGQQPLGQQPLGQQPLGQQPLGQQPLGQQPLGQQPLGQQPLGQQPLGQQPLGQQPLNPEQIQQLLNQPLDQELNQIPLNQISDQGRQLINQIVQTQGQIQLNQQQLNLASQSIATRLQQQLNLNQFFINGLNMHLEQLQQDPDFLNLDDEFEQQQEGMQSYQQQRVQLQGVQQALQQLQNPTTQQLSNIMNQSLQIQQQNNQLMEQYGPLMP